MFAKLFNRISSSKPQIEATVQYSAPHWIVLIRNPGQKEWLPLLDKDTKIEAQNEFGEVAKTRNAIRTFDNAIHAQNWIDENVYGNVHKGPVSSRISASEPTLSGAPNA